MDRIYLPGNQLPARQKAEDWHSPKYWQQVHVPEFAQPDPTPKPESCAHGAVGMVTLPSGTRLCKSCYVEYTARRNLAGQGRYRLLWELRQHYGELPQLSWKQVRLAVSVLRLVAPTFKELQTYNKLSGSDLADALRRLREVGMVRKVGSCYVAVDRRSKNE